MDLGRKAATRPSSHAWFWTPFLHQPHADVHAQSWNQSSPTSMSASSPSVLKTICNIPLSAQRLKRLSTLYHFPYSLGRERSRPPPLCPTQSTPSTNHRAPCRPRKPRQTTSYSIPLIIPSILHIRHDAHFFGRISYPFKYVDTC